MKIAEVLKEAGALTAEILLSCGPSQMFGVVKGAIDLYKYARIWEKIYLWRDVHSQYAQGRYEELKKTDAFKKLRTSDVSHLNAKAERRLFYLEQQREQRLLSLKKDLICLIPVVGALFAWRVGAPAEEKSLWKHTPFIRHAVAHAVQDISKLIAYLLYPGHCTPISDMIRIQEGRINLPVAAKNRTLDAVWQPSFADDPKAPTVVLTHGNGMVCHEMSDIAFWYKSEGFNVLMVTMGGYEGSPGVRTSEQSSYEDVEAIKLFLDSKGVQYAGYHGLSIGATLAFQAAAGVTEAKVKTLFVVADQTLTSAKEVFANLVANRISKWIAPIAEGLAQAAVPPRLRVRLSKTLVVETDGLDNKAKAAKMQERGIPLFAIMAVQDALMGRRWKGNQFEENFAHDLLQARYGDVKAEHLMALRGKHCSPLFDCEGEEIEKFRQFLAQAKKTAVEG